MSLVPKACYILRCDGCRKMASLYDTEEEAERTARKLHWTQAVLAASAVSVHLCPDCNLRRPVWWPEPPSPPPKPEKPE